MQSTEDGVVRVAEVGGLTPREVLELLRALNGLDVIGADVVEVRGVFFIF